MGIIGGWFEWHARLDLVAMIYTLFDAANQCTKKGWDIVITVDSFQIFFLNPIFSLFSFSVEYAIHSQLPGFGRSSFIHLYECWGKIRDIKSGPILFGASMLATRVPFENIVMLIDVDRPFCWPNADGRKQTKEVVRPDAEINSQPFLVYNPIYF